jgi:predicted CopG family antitoxin
MAKYKKRKTPSRIKYEQSHPTVSFRVSKELYDRLQSVKKAEGKSIAEVLKVGVGLLEVKVRKEKEIRDQAYEEGWEKGASEAEEARIGT